MLGISFDGAQDDTTDGAKDDIAGAKDDTADGAQDDIAAGPICIKASPPDYRRQAPFPQAATHLLLRETQSDGSCG